MQTNFLLEFLPLLSFFGTYYITRNLYTATMICIAASWAAILISKLSRKPIGKNTWISTLAITIFGGLTIALHNKTFIMLKPTVLYFIFSVSLYVANKAGKNLIELMLKEHLALPAQVWQQINWLWIGFFITMGILNLIIAFHFSEYVWVKFKVFGGLALMLVNMLITGIFIQMKAKGKFHG